MTCNEVVVAGLQLPCDHPLFLAVLAAHVPFGIACTITGIAAMLSKKRPGQHPFFGRLYYWGLAVVVVTAGLLAAMRWAEDYYLFVLGGLSFAAALIGRAARRQRWRGWLRWHILGMGCSYVLMLTAFYVDNGKNLPVWQKLPPLTFWLLPGLVGLPLIGWALWRHPLVRDSTRTARARPTR